LAHVNGSVCRASRHEKRIQVKLKLKLRLKLRAQIRKANARAAQAKQLHFLIICGAAVENLPPSNTFRNGGCRALFLTFLWRQLNNNGQDPADMRQTTIKIHSLFGFFISISWGTSKRELAGPAIH